MDVTIKTFAVDMEVKNKGIEFEVRNPNGGEHQGDLILTKTQLIWCEGKIHRKNGKAVTWEQFRNWINSLP